MPPKRSTVTMRLVNGVCASVCLVDFMNCGVDESFGFVERFRWNMRILEGKPRADGFFVSRGCCSSRSIVTVGCAVTFDEGAHASISDSSKIDILMYRCCRCLAKRAILGRQCHP